MPTFDYVALAIESIQELLMREGVVVWSEVEAKLADVPWGSSGIHIDPHHLSTARRLLLDAGLIGQLATPTRGGRVVEVLYGDVDVRTLRMRGGRKRLLQGRYLGWALGTKRHPTGLVGGGAEEVVRASLLAAAPAGYLLAQQQKGEVRSLLGADVPGGSLDNAAFLQVISSQGIPVGTVVLPIEVKNLRDWIYPTAPELYQLLDKSGRLQNKHPDLAIVPVLICRRAHFTTFKMAKALGFYVIDLRRQYLLPSADLDATRVEEVRNELGFVDLFVSSEADSTLIRHFTTHLPSVATRSAERWRQSAEVLGGWFKTLRKPIAQPERATLMTLFRHEAASVVGAAPGGW